MMLLTTRCYATVAVLFIGVVSAYSRKSEFSSDVTDKCYTEPWNKNAGECLLILIEAYYGKRMSWTCPNLPELFIELKCEGCPWNRVDSRLVEESNITWNPGVDPQRVFHPAEESCRLAQHVRTYASEGAVVRRRIRFFGIFGPLLLLVISSILSYNVAADVSLFRFGGHIVPEPWFMLASWVVFYIGIIFTIASEDYYLVCESFATSLLLNLSRFVGYGSLLAASAQRYRKLQALHVDNSAPEANWSSFVRQGQSSPHHRVCTLVYYGTALALLAVFIADIVLRQAYRRCRAGLPRVAFGIFKYSQLVIEVSSLTIYSTGYSRDLARFWARYITLLIIAVLSIILFVLSFDIDPLPSTLIPHVFDADVSGNTNSMHALCVAVLGLIEPLRLGWPQKPQHLNEL